MGLVTSYTIVGMLIDMVMPGTGRGCVGQLDNRSERQCKEGADPPFDFSPVR